MRLLLLALAFFGASVQPSFAETVWYPLPPEAYSFGSKYPEAQKLLFAFDYGHSLVYERLLVNRGKIADPAKFEQSLLTDIIAILKNPPATKQDESDIAPNYVFTFPLVLNEMDWSHLLHQFVLDVLATSPDRGQPMIDRIQQVFAQYKANKAVAITDSCKSMVYMDGQYFSKAFRRAYPSFNLLIWSYHWFQIKLFESLMNPTQAGRDAAVAAVVKRFWDLISNLPDSADFDDMPYTAKEAPDFAKAFPFLPPSFDNNHMLHDIISDILTSDRVTDTNVRAEGLKFGRMDLDPTAYQAPCGSP